MSTLTESKSDFMRGAILDLPPAPSLETLARDRLLAIAVGLAVLHWLAAASYLPDLKALYREVLQPGPTSAWPMLSLVLLAAVSGLFLLILRWLLPRLPLRWGEPLSALVGTLAVGNALAGLAVSNVPLRTLALAMVVVCSGFFLFSKFWLGLVGGVALGGWVALAWQPTFAPEGRGYALLLVLAVGAAFLIQRLQLRTVRSLLGAQTHAPAPAPAAGLAAGEAEERFLRWFEASSECIAIHDRGVIVEASPPLAALLGCSSAELVGQNLLQWFTAASRPMIEDSLLLGNYRPFEAVVCRADKSELPLELFSKQLPYKGKLLMVTSFRDVSERERASAALLAEQLQLQEQYRRQTALAQIEFNIDQPGELQQLLQQITRAARHLPTDGGTCLLLCGPTGPTLAAAELNQNLAGRDFAPATQLATVMDWIVQHRESLVVSQVAAEDPFGLNRPLPVLGACVGQPLFEQGQVLGVLFVVEEHPRQFKPEELDFLNALAGRASLILSKTRLYEQLRQANLLLEQQSGALLAKNQELGAAMEGAQAASKAKSVFLATISHDLRTPLNGVMGMTNLLLGSNPSAEQRDYLETLETSAQALLTSINHILDYVAADDKAAALQTGRFNVRETLTGVLDRFRQLAASKSVALHTLLTDSLPTEVCGNSEALGQVLGHLLDNALKFTERGDVALGATRQSENGARIVLRFTVSDTGIGIAPEVQQQLFQSFSQADGSHARQHGGLGLGLAICRQLVERLGGTIGVESTPGQGATFWFTLPFERSQPAAAAA